MQSIKQQKIHITTNIKNLKNKIYDENSEINVYKRHIKMMTLVLQASILPNKYCKNSKICISHSVQNSCI